MILFSAKLRYRRSVQCERFSILPVEHRSSRVWLHRLYNTACSDSRWNDVVLKIENLELSTQRSNHFDAFKLQLVQRYLLQVRDKPVMVLRFPTDQFFCEPAHLSFAAVLKVVCCSQHRCVELCGSVFTSVQVGEDRFFKSNKVCPIARGSETRRDIHELHGRFSKRLNERL